jgi:hypothetical protein
LDKKVAPLVEMALSRNAGFGLMSADSEPMAHRRSRMQSWAASPPARNRKALG